MANVEKLEQLYEGKAKKVFKTSDPELYIVEYKDDATALNGLKKGTIRGKGVVNNRMSNYMMSLLEKEGVPTHFVEELSDRETLVKKVTIVPLEVIVRNIAAGSFSKRYGVKEGTELSIPTIEFSLKNDDLGDPLINDYHALAINLCTKEELETIKKYAFAVNDFMKAYLLKAGVILVDFKLEFGKLSDGTPAVFATGVNSQGMAMTDILVWQESGGLTNIAQDRTTGLTAAVYPYMQLKPQDIDGDGSVEIPAPETAAADAGSGAAANTAAAVRGLVRWISYCGDESPDVHCVTYHDLSAGWYFRLPDTWQGEATFTTAENGAYESQVVLLSNGQPVAALYALTGDNREKRAMMGSRMALKRQNGVTYGGELLAGADYCGLDEESLRLGFNLVVAEWAA